MQPAALGVPQPVAPHRCRHSSRSVRRSESILGPQSFDDPPSPKMRGTRRTRPERQRVRADRPDQLRGVLQPPLDADSADEWTIGAGPRSLIGAGMSWSDVQTSRLAPLLPKLADRRRVLRGDRPAGVGVLQGEYDTGHPFAPLAHRRGPDTGRSRGDLAEGWRPERRFSWTQCGLRVSHSRSNWTYDRSYTLKRNSTTSPSRIT